MWLCPSKMRAAQELHTHPCHNVLDTLTKPCILRSEDKEKAVLQPSVQNAPVARGLDSEGRTIAEKPFISTVSLPPCPGPFLFHPSTHGHRAASGVGGQDACQADVPWKHGGLDSMCCPSSHPHVEDAMPGAGPSWQGSVLPSLTENQVSYMFQLLLVKSVPLPGQGPFRCSQGRFLPSMMGW